MQNITVFRGASFTRGTPSKQKVIVFDLDETLGSFSDLSLLWQAILPFTNDSAAFRELLDLYPEFLRPGIFPILEYLRHKKRAGLCSNIFLYTNNQGSREWVDLIVDYFNSKIPGLFDRVVCAFKIGNQRIEQLRTTNSKTYSDLIRCTMLPKNAEMCFIDNMYHPRMAHDRVYYIQPKSYYHGLLADEIINRFMTQWKGISLPGSFESTLYEYFLHKWPNKREQNISLDSFTASHKVSQKVSQKIMYHLKEYFLMATKTPRTKKISLSLGKFTRKKR